MLISSTRLKNLARIYANSIPFVTEYNLPNKTNVSELTRRPGLAVTVDEVYGEQGSSAGAFTSLTLGYLYLGGSENTVALPGTKASTNFVGCIRKYLPKRLNLK
ncbi:neurexin-1 [Aphis craccivora]|uniref:Neurexin-1 n=1 Tax=Aphis craccivora TaxID=307492 RepID=A0A6G0Z9P6_APHCR|nr:neurexin-1 [Aphis craccivora]